MSTENKRSNTFGILAIITSIIAFNTPRFLLSMVLIALACFIVIGFVRDSSKVLSTIALGLGLFLLYLIVQDENARVEEQVVETNRKNEIYDVRYHVICPQCDVNYTNETGGTDHYKKVPVEWERTMRLKGEQFVYLSAQNSGYGSTVTVMIYVNGRLLKEESSSGEYAIASVSCRPIDIYE